MTRIFPCCKRAPSSKAQDDTILHHLDITDPTYIHHISYKRDALPLLHLGRKRCLQSQWKGIDASGAMPESLCSCPPLLQLEGQTATLMADLHCGRTRLAYPCKAQRNNKRTHCAWAEGDSILSAEAAGVRSLNSMKNTIVMHINWPAFQPQHLQLPTRDSCLLVTSNQQSSKGGSH